MDELLDNLLFSATLPRVAFPDPKKPPLPIERIVHNGARRRLAERYGFEEYRDLAEREHTRCFARQHPWMIQALMFGTVSYGLWSMLTRSRSPKSN
jgi:hypothetical protein